MKTLRKIKKFIVEMPKVDVVGDVFAFIGALIVGAMSAAISCACGLALWLSIAIGLMVGLLVWGYDLSMLWTQFSDDQENHRPRRCTCEYFGR